MKKLCIEDILLYDDGKFFYLYLLYFLERGEGISWKVIDNFRTNFMKALGFEVIYVDYLGYEYDEEEYDIYLVHIYFNKR